MKNIYKIPLIIVGVLVLGAGTFAATHSGFGIDAANPPKFIQADFIDLKNVASVSKFRSGAGHDFSGNGETCRSMKHYYSTIAEEASRNSGSNMKSKDGLPPKPDGKTDIPIYSPVDGTIVQIGQEHTPIGNQIYIVSDKNSQFTIRLFHVYPLPGIKGGVMGVGGTKVKAGQQIGVIGQYQGTDISVQIGRMPWNETFLSYFDVMPDSVFASYREQGIATRDQLIISKAERDASPFECVKDQTEAFIHPQNYDQNADYIYINGIQPPDHTQMMDMQGMHNMPGMNGVAPMGDQGQMN